MNNKTPLQNIKNKLLTNFFSLSILEAFNIFLLLITLPYLVRVLKVENFGIVMLAQFYNLSITTK